MVGIARALAVAGYEVLAVAGNNERLERRLRDVSTGNRGLQVFGFVDDMPSLMAACDVFVTTPGVSCWEARAMGRPIVLFDSAPGHGRENLLHELELGGAAVSSPQPKCVLEAVSAVVESSDCAMPEPWDPKAFARDLGDALGALGRPSL
jgi:UDP-N-acetylglucosamine:LPS N-acetylglucosamine transferase